MDVISNSMQKDGYRDFMLVGVIFTYSPITVFLSCEFDSH